MTTAQITAVLRALEERLTAIDERLILIEDMIGVFYRSLTLEGGTLRVGLRDLLDIKGSTVMGGEVIGILRDEVQAMIEVLTMYHGREIENGRRSIAQGVTLHSMSLLLDALASTQDPDIAQQAREARALLHEEAERQIAELEQHAQAARAVLKSARLDAIAVVKHAVEDAKDEIAAAASDARDKLEQESNE